MMLEPSIDKLLEKVPSKYSLIILAGRRSKEMQVNHDMQLEKYKSVKTVGKALEEVVADQLYIQEN